MTSSTIPKPVLACRCCGNPNLIEILSLGVQSLTGVFPRTRGEKISEGPLELVKCHGEGTCGLVQLRHSFDSSQMYGQNYGYRSSLNQSMVEHLRTKAESLLRKIPVAAGDVVLDIGSNDGTLLSFMPPETLRVGMDPTIAKFGKYYQAGITPIPEFFSAESYGMNLGDRRAKIVTSIAMFYDLEEPLSFMKQVASVLADDGVWHFEQSYLPSMLEHNAYDTICHEHLEYYSLHQIQWMAERCELRVLDVEINDVNGGSFAVTLCKQGASHVSEQAAIQRLLQAEDDAQLHTMAPYEAFKRCVFSHRDELLETIRNLISQGASILGYGASTKGNVILQFCGLTANEIPAIAEVNTDKFGSFTPGTLIPIISEAEARARNPDYLLVMPWHFRENLVRREMEFLAKGGRMIFPLPTISIVSQ